MRLSLKRLLILSYFTLCALLAVINFRYASTVTDQQSEIDTESKIPIDKNQPDSNNETRSGIWQKFKNSFTIFWRENLKSERGASDSIMDDSVWPEDTNISDRIITQMNLLVDIHPVTAGEENSQIGAKPIVIHLVHGLSAWGIENGDTEFVRQKCPMKNCLVTESKDSAATADAIIFRNHYSTGMERISMDQIWIYYTLESPENTPSLSLFGDQINWTATYRYDSDLVTPYEKFQTYSTQDDILKNSKSSPSPVNYAKNKTKYVAWFVSNCMTSNRRQDYVRELAKYIQVDIYGACGQFKCSRTDAKCGKILDEEYRFYLAFENSNCQDYITEKFFVQGLQHDVIPIVMGARKSEYLRSAPPHSFIHVEDFESPAQLAAYLHKLVHNDVLYNEYFQWKGTGNFINTKFWCRLCAMLNAPRRKYYKDLNNWWRAEDMCTRGKWTNDNSDHTTQTNRDNTQRRKV